MDQQWANLALNWEQNAYEMHDATAADGQLFLLSFC